MYSLCSSEAQGFCHFNLQVPFLSVPSSRLFPLPILFTWKIQSLSLNVLSYACSPGASDAEQVGWWTGGHPGL